MKGAGPAGIKVNLYNHWPSLTQLINKGKGEALRIRAILRSLVPTEDLVGIISIPLRMPVVNKGRSGIVKSVKSLRLFGKMMKLNRGLK